MDYVRELLLKIEADGLPVKSSTSLMQPGATDEDQRRLNYHLEMVIDEAKLVKAIPAHHMQGREWINLQLTWTGHEFIETVRDAEVWQRTKAGAKKAGNFGLDFILEIAKAYGKHVAKERLGIDLS
ncbi:MAG: DUF2513 domain-containing protein [Pseudomonadota bacterium]